MLLCTTLIINFMHLTGQYKAHDDDNDSDDWELRVNGHQLRSAGTPGVLQHRVADIKMSKVLPDFTLRLATEQRIHLHCTCPNDTSQTRQHYDVFSNRRREPRRSLFRQIIRDESHVCTICFQQRETHTSQTRFDLQRHVRRFMCKHPVFKTHLYIYIYIHLYSPFLVDNWNIQK